MTSPKIWFVTGASSGLGAALCRAVIARGDCLVAGARRTERLQPLRDLAPDRILTLPLDLTDEGSRQSAIDAAETRFGRIDVLANVAGRGINGAGEELSSAQLRQAFELNFFGTVELTRAVLPGMRRRRSGHILSVTSICGLVSLPDLGAYSASKFALEAWMEALAGEIEDLGLRCTLVEPGAFRTEFEGDKIIRPLNRIADYAPLIGPIEASLSAHAGSQPGDPDRAAEVIVRAVEAPHSPMRLILGSDAHAMWQAHLGQLTADIARWRSEGLATDFPQECHPSDLRA